MDRARTVFTPAVLALGAALAGAPTATAIAAERTTIVFVNNGMAPVLCTSRPEIGSVAIQRGEPVLLANATGVEATVDFGGGQVVTVADGHGVSVRLAPGRHLVSMVPTCLATGEIVAAVVDVREPAAMPTTTPPSPSRPAQASTGTTATSGPGTAAAAWPTPGGRSRSAPRDSSSPVSAGASGNLMLERGSQVEEVFPLNRPPDERDERLLGIIAAICVFGVTTAIIRAIVSQRASRVLGT